MLGDAAIAADMPKSAFTAVSQAGVVAADILADLSGKERAAGKYRNTCWSMVAPDNSAKIGGDYVPAKKDGKAFLEVNEPFVSKAGESADLRRETFNESVGLVHGARHRHVRQSAAGRRHARCGCTFGRNRARR